MEPNERHPERAQCVFTASSVPEACGIGYGARGAWARGERSQPDAARRRRLENGSHGEFSAAGTYRKHLVDKHNEQLDGEEFRMRYTELGDIGASPDGVVRGAPVAFNVRLVEYKCIDGCGEDRALAPLRANHVLQLATQLYVYGLRDGHLFYYRSSGEYVCYWVRVKGAEHYEGVVFPWLREALAVRADPAQKMPPGEAQRRRETVVREFLIV